MKKEIVINSTPNEVRIGLLEDGELVEISVERTDVKRVVGNVYKGRVTAVRPGLQAAFVDIGMEKAGFLHVSDLVHESNGDDDDRGGRRPRRGRRDSMRPIETMIREGDEILVQVTKEVIGTKGPRLTADISLPGRFLVMMPRGDHVGVSRKIEDRRERVRLRELLTSLRPKDAQGAYIIRTAGLGIAEKMLQHDMEYLHGLWVEMEANAKNLPAPNLVHEDVGLIVGLVRDIFKEDIDALYMDNREDYDRLMRYVKTFAPDLRSRVQMYSGDVPIFDKYGIEAEIKKSLDRKVWMKRGGFLVIDQTEAMVTIDINTGRFTGKKNQEDTIFRTNMIAAREIPRQLRLRDIGGIIVIDFIDMENESDKRKVLAELRTHLRRDRSRTKTFGMSDLGLVEMSRQRVRESLKDQLSDDCPFCRGTGQVLSLETLANKVENLLSKVALRSGERSIQVQANPTLALALLGERAHRVQSIAEEYGLKLSVIDDARLHREDFRIVELRTRRDLVSLLEDGARRSSGRDRDADARRGRRSGRSDRDERPAARGDSGGRERDRDDDRGRRRRPSRRRQEGDRDDAVASTGGDRENRRGRRTMRRRSGEPTERSAAPPEAVEEGRSPRDGGSTSRRRRRRRRRRSDEGYDDAVSRESSESSERRSRSSSRSRGGDEPVRESTEITETTQTPEAGDSHETTRQAPRSHRSRFSRRSSRSSERANTDSTPEEAMPRAREEREAEPPAPSRPAPEESPVPSAPASAPVSGRESSDDDDDAGGAPRRRRRRRRTRPRTGSSRSGSGSGSNSSSDSGSGGGEPPLAFSAGSGDSD